MIGFWQRVGLAFRSWYGILVRAEIPSDIPERLAGSTVAKIELGLPAAPAIKALESPSDSADRAVQMLALLQRDGRLLDFLAEDVSPYPDAQLGAAVRSVHESCRKVLEDYVKLEPIIASEEDQPVTVPAGFDPAAVKLIGTVTGDPPLRGLLRHRGWRVKEIKLPSLPVQAARKVVAPAEVEVQ